MASLTSRCVKHFLWKSSITWDHFLKHVFFLFVETRDLHLHGTSCHFLPGYGVLTTLSSHYQRSSWCCTDTSFPLLPKGTGELCWAVWDEIKGKPLTWHFIISCHHWRAATQPLMSWDLAAWRRLDRDTGTKAGGGAGTSSAGPWGVLQGKGSLGMKCRLWVLVL